MKLVDANILLYAYHPASEQHARSRSWLESALSGPEVLCLAWTVILAFLRISTHPRIFEKPLGIREASAIVGQWLGRAEVVVVTPGEGHWEILRELLGTGQAGADLVMDAHLAALAREHGATLYTTDRDFTRFPGVRIVNPLA